MRCLNCVYAWKTCGLPKGADDVARPLPVASLLVRTWHSAICDDFPEPPASQYCCRRCMSVVRATATWLSTKPKAGAELDLSKAFDTLEHPMVETAMLARGKHAKAINLLKCAWKAPRYCVIKGRMAKPIWPTISVPQRCPASPQAMCDVLAPWETGAQQHAWMDDRTISSHHEDPVEAANIVQRAIDATMQFDSSVGVIETQGRDRFGILVLRRKSST